MGRFVGSLLVGGLALGAAAQGCAALCDVSQGPRPYGGTRLLLDDPLPVEPDAPDAPVLASALWLVDLPLTLALDTALFPLAAAWTLVGDPAPAVVEPAVARELTANRG